MDLARQMEKVKVSKLGEIKSCEKEEVQEEEEEEEEEVKEEPKPSVPDIDIDADRSDIYRRPHDAQVGGVQYMLGLIDWVEVLHPIMHASSYGRWPCKGHGVDCLWFLLLLKPKTGGDKR